MRSRHFFCIWLFVVLQTFCACVKASSGYVDQQVARQPEGATTRQAIGAPVIVDNRTLFYVPARMFTFSPEDRAKAVSERVDWLSHQSPEQIRAVHTEEAETTTAIVSGEVVLATVTDSDAQLTGKSRQAHAQEYAQATRQGTLALREEHSMRKVLFGVLYSLIATVLLLAVFKLLSFGFGMFYTKLKSWRGVCIRSIRIQQLELLPAKRINPMTDDSRERK